MNNGIFKISWTNIKSALVYGLMVTLLTTIIYVINVGDLRSVNWYTVINMLALGSLGAVASVLKNLLTTTKGNFVGIVKVIPSTKSKE